MVTEFVATNAASSGVKLDRKTIKALCKRSDRSGLVWLAQWLTVLSATGYLLHVSLGTWWVVPAMVVYGVVLTLPTYALSHETAHGTAFRTRWLNETALWLSSLIYFEEPYHRRYSHTSHHTCTLHVGKDGQMPFDLPMNFQGWLKELSGFSLYCHEVKLFWRNAFGRFTPMVREYTPARELRKLQWGARVCLACYAGLLGLVLAGYSWPLMYLIIPRLVGGPAMQMFTFLQHAEVAENSPSILASTRSFRTSWPGRFLYMNMNHHVEHHLYPQVPFYALPALNEALADQLPEPDPGVWRTNLELLSVVIRRSLGKNTKAWTIRQAPQMITEGGYTRIAQGNMR